MEHIHIELLGREVQPAYNMLNVISPHKVFFICSEQTKPSIQRLIDLFKEKGRILNTEIVILEPQNLTNINNYIDNQLIPTLSDDDAVTINLMGGTKFWSLAFYDRFSKREKTSFYLLGQDNTLWDLSNGNSTRLPEIDIDTILELQGQKISKYKLLSDYTQEDEQSMSVIEQLRKRNYGIFNNLATTLTKENQDKLKKKEGEIFDEKNKANYVKWGEEPNFVEFSIAGTTKRIESPNVKNLAFNSGWFEYKVAKLIEKWEKSNRIRLNSVFISNTENKNNKSAPAKNEIDIIIETDSKPIFVECKTQIKNHTDLDKFSTVVKNFIGKSGKAIFVTYEPAKKIVLEKCKESGIAYFCLKDMKTEKRDLINFLDSVYNTINA
jgi:hypothetical protein